MLRSRRICSTAAAVGGIVVVAGIALPARGQVAAGQVDDFEDGTVHDWTAGSPNPNPPTNIAAGGPGGLNDNFMRLTSTGNAGAGGRLVAFNFTQWAGDYLDEGISSLQMQVNNLGATSLTLRLILSDASSGQSLCTVAPVNVPAGSGWSTVSFPLTSGNLDGGGFGEFETVMAGVTELNLVHSPSVISFRSGAPNIAAQIGVDNITAVGTPATVYYWDTNGAAAGAGGGASPSGNWDGVATNFNTDATGGGAGTIAASPGAGDTVSFAAGNSATGSYTVTVSGTRAAGKLEFTEGSVTVAGGTLDVDSFDVSTGITGTVTSAVAASSTNMTKSGEGTLRVPKLPQGHFVDVSEGTVQVLESSPGVSSGHPSGDNASVSRPSSLTVSAGAKLDLTNNDLIIDYSGDTPIASYEALVASGYNVTGDWQGSGITSSIAANDGNYVVAIADNATLAAPFGSAQGGPLFAGVDVDLDTILIKFTHRADINLDGVITPDDSAVFGGNYDEGAPAVWATGDMNYDGVFTPDDAAIFGGAYDESLASLPEPMTVGAVMLLVPVLSRRRKTAPCSKNR